MKTKKQILDEIEIRKKAEDKPSTYGQFRSNKTVISTLKAVLELPSNVKWHADDVGVDGSGGERMTGVDRQ